MHGWILRNRTFLPRTDLPALRGHFTDLSETQVMMACRFLMDAGVCFFHEQLGLVVLDPQVLANDMKEVHFWLFSFSQPKLSLLIQVISFYSGVKVSSICLSSFLMLTESLFIFL
jgi:hypothetical protein